MAITSDWHIHTKYSCDSACMEYETLVSEMKKLGITDYGVTDHYHTRIQEPDIAASRKEYEITMEKYPELEGHFHFGIEATIISQWEVDKIARGDYTELPVYGFRSGGPANAPIMFDFDEDFLEKYKIEYVVSGMHWPMYCATDLDSVLKEYHRQYMFAATHPYTRIMAHYLWFDINLFRNVWNIPDYEDPFLDFSVIPQGMKSEIKAAMLENNVAFELNNCFFKSEIKAAMIENNVAFDPDNCFFKSVYPEHFCSSYLDWVSELQSSGVQISMGSDCHAKKVSDSCDYSKIDDLCLKHGINTSAFLCL